jgi:DNA-binding IclR family transcriptional regulator
MRKVSKAAPVPEKKATGPRVRPVPAVTRSIAILRLLGSSPSPLGVKAIADELDLVPSTCLHILRVLVDEELLKVDPATKRYSLGPGMLALARSALKRGGFNDVVQPYLDDISAKFGVTVMGVEPRG